MPPSVVYRLTVDSPVYRASELMFGSLLASYILGFVGFLLVRLVELIGLSGASGLLSFDNLLPNISRLSQYAAFPLISLSYAYITAGLFVFYQAGILTMPHMPLHRLSVDFFISLALAIFFGVSMFFPDTFPFWIAVIVLILTFRKKHEIGYLAGDLYDKLLEKLRRIVDIEKPTFPDKNQYKRETKKKKEAKRAFGQRLKQVLNSAECERLTGWRTMRIVHSALGVIGLSLLGFLPTVFAQNRWPYYEHAPLSVAVVTTAVVVIYLHRNLRDRAHLLYYRMQDMDVEFAILVCNLGSYLMTDKRWRSE